MKLIDAHTHVFPADPDRIALVNLTPDRLTVPSLKNLFFSCGIHPRDIDRFTMNELREALKKIPSSAIGECGLDRRVPADPERQESVFLAQIALSEELRRPLVIHCVRQQDRLLRLRRETRAGMPWLVHGFRGKRELGEALLNAGCLLSLSPVWLLHQTEFPVWLPSDSFLLETDESPIPLPEIYAQTAQLRSESMDTLSRLLEKNFQTFLRQ